MALGFVAISAVQPIVANAQGNQTGAGPSFSCSDAQSQSEKAICGSEELSRKDRLIFTAFSNAQSATTPEAARSFARTMLKNRYLCKSDVDCLSEQMSITELRFSIFSRFSPEIIEGAYRNLSRSDAIKLQRTLKEKGFYSSDIDGLWGVNTSEGIYAGLGSYLMDWNTTQISIDTSDLFEKISRPQSDLHGCIDCPVAEYVEGEDEEELPSYDDQSRIVSNDESTETGEDLTPNPPTQPSPPTNLRSVEDLVAICADNPASIFGLCWDQTIPEMAKIIESKDFLPSDGKPEYPDVLYFVNSEKQEITVSPKGMYFDCGVFSLCQTSLMQIGIALQERYMVDVMEPDSEYVEMYQTRKDSYCGYLDTGEEICTIEIQYPFTMLNKGPAVVFYRGRNQPGSDGKINFD
jgi:hypothetical protein